MISTIRAILIATAISSNRPKVLEPRLRMNVTSRTISTAGRLMNPPLASKAVAVIDVGSARPVPARKASR